MQWGHWDVTFQKVTVGINHNPFSKPLPADPRLDRLKRAVELSQKQLENERLTAAQDIAWALINTPSFLFNR